MPARGARPNFQLRILGSLLQRGPGFLRGVACSRLGYLATHPNPSSALAAGILARSLDTPLTPTLRRKITDSIANIQQQECVDIVWQTWMATRNKDLFTALQRIPYYARKPVSAQVFSILASPLPIPAALGASQDEIPPLIEATCGPLPALAQSALEAIRRLTRPSAIDAVCEAWAVERVSVLEDLIVDKQWIARRPPEVRLLTCMLQNQLSAVLHTDGDLIGPLIAACNDTNPMIAARARSCLPALQSQAAIDAFCRAWHDTRGAMLENALLQACYLPAAPYWLRLKAGFKTGRIGLLKSLSPQTVPDWLECLTDRDETIREAAQQAAVDLSPECRAEVCRLAIYEGNTAALAIAARFDIQPETISDQALLLFLQQRWAEYAALDYDFNLMETAYFSAPDDLRQRIAAGVRLAARPEFLTILSGGDIRYRSASYSPEEAEILFSILTANHGYAQLWHVLPQFPLNLALRALRVLSSSGWQPDTESEKQELAHWVSQAQALPDDLDGVFSSIPWALPCSSLRVDGRINAIAFAPNEPYLAVATGNRRLVIWDFAQAAVHTTYPEFSHSLALVVYADEHIYCAERSNSSAVCSVYHCIDGKAVKIGMHTGPITSLIPLDGYRLISTGRDGKISCWDVSTDPVGEISAQAGDWPRSALLCNDQSLLLTFTARIQSWQIPELIPRFEIPFRRLRASGYRSSPIYAAALTLAGDALLTGQANGRVLAYEGIDSTTDLARALITTHDGAVKHLSFPGSGHLLATAGAEGQIRLFSWPDLKSIGDISLPQGRLASLQFSPDGSFMAAGGSEAELTLWDLRMDRLRAILRSPLSACTAADLSLCSGLANNAAIQPHLRGALGLIASMLRYRFRFDIQIDDAYAIKPGEFDILL